jgi:hypothetical protein
MSTWHARTASAAMRIWPPAPPWQSSAVAAVVGTPAVAPVSRRALKQPPIPTHAQRHPAVRRRALRVGVWVTRALVRPTKNFL